MPHVAIADSRGRKSEVGGQYISRTVFDGEHLAPCVVLVGFDDGAGGVGKCEHAVQMILQRVIGVRFSCPVDCHGEQIINSGAPCIASDEVSVFVEVGGDLVAVVNIVFGVRGKWRVES